MYSVVRKFFFIQLNFDIKDIKEKHFSHVDIII